MKPTDILKHLAENSAVLPETFRGAGSRQDGDFSRVEFIGSNNCKHLIVHRQSIWDEVILEVHTEIGRDGQQLDKPVMISYSLTPEQRYNLALYLLQTVVIYR